MTEQGNSSGRTGTIIVYITVIGSVLGFITLIIGPFLRIPGIPERLCVMVRLCETAEFSIMVPKDPNLLADFMVSIDGEQVANLSSNQEPNSISVNGFQEGSYEYQ